MCLPPREEVAKTCIPHQRFQRSSPNPVVDDDEDHVTFAEHDIVHETPTSLSSLGQDQDRRHELWYSRDDMKEFRRQAAALSKKLSSSCRPLSSDDDSCCPRGLELRMSLQRQDQKQLYVTRILDAQDDDATPEELAQIAQGHSAWPKKLALAQAHKDYYAVYHPNLTSAVLPEMPTLLDCSRDLRKRSLTATSMTGRRVRCRMY